MDIKIEDRGVKMINKVGELLTERKQIKIMKIYSGYVTIITRDCECDEFFCHSVIIYMLAIRQSMICICIFKVYLNSNYSYFPFKRT